MQAATKMAFAIYSAEARLALPTRCAILSPGLASPWPWGLLALCWLVPPPNLAVAILVVRLRSWRPVGWRLYGAVEGQSFQQLRPWVYLFGRHEIHVRWKMLLKALVTIGVMGEFTLKT